MKNHIITLTEKDLHKVIKESVKKLLKEKIAEDVPETWKQALRGAMFMYTDQGFDFDSGSMDNFLNALGGYANDPKFMDWYYEKFYEWLESDEETISEGIIDKAKNIFKPKEMSQEELDVLREKARKLGEYCNEHPNDEFAYYKYLKLVRKAYK